MESGPDRVPLYHRDRHDVRPAQPQEALLGLLDPPFERLAVERGTHFPTAQYRDNESGYEGAYVMRPAEGMGILRNVHVADFASLYPSIIITWNMSLETRKDMPVNGPIAPGHARSPLNGVTFEVERDGILPEALRTMIKMRKVYNDKKSAEPPGTDAWKSYDRISTAYKVAANSFYGVLGTTNSRFYVRAIAESVTKCGRWLIESTISEARRWKLETVYGDTDSVFVLSGLDDAAGPEALGRAGEALADFFEWRTGAALDAWRRKIGRAHV